jgi:hypothetical protein
MVLFKSEIYASFTDLYIAIMEKSMPKITRYRMQQGRLVKDDDGPIVYNNAHEITVSWWRNHTKYLEGQLITMQLTIDAIRRANAERDAINEKNLSTRQLKALESTL